MTLPVSPLTVACASLLMGYVCGSFLTADVVSRAVARKSAFDLGVGNPGMANVGHELGTRAALVVLAGDVLKCVLAWTLARWLFTPQAELAGLMAGLGCTLGHNYPLWHGFTGGKGVTTTCSAIILATPLWGVLACLTGFAAVLASGYLCVGAVVIAGAYLILTLVLHGPGLEALVALALALLMTRAHWSALVATARGTQRPANLAIKLRARLGMPPLRGGRGQNGAAS
ncbi:glycerol-3-phosphate acyltransferase [Olsenella sp. HMSC062G07]|uniref:glycerol-3-phosphate acyltransferase n=1 Tax=Olsenella sp. HMSC062G07 TaxID=1739330 RepID=UPI0008A2DC68|nr:glycerol-3-phosphate acyltransferase [Olsenella sp. HMSC062G07]OFK23896.1 hypothetical protein HMPREF2826_03860 [Olsenella sp. HMSC062G07]